ncbi:MULTISPECIES: pyridoxamine 5'-phosphate oxidase family protein [Methylotenera]|uniref:pyridoxamine 5'-phosphate oxidase family protein n=1 Tax=Methylotenera TaxID=359407 RepID=UPI0003A5EC15|nr:MULTISPECIES: pyridoxamine 5'-phosphate oxidase family protein [Methylotenera]
MKNSKLYLSEHRVIQDKFGTRALADKQEELIVHEVFTKEDAEFILTRDMFFLSTLNSRGEPTVSYKGGPVGFVKVIDNELIFPNYDGNGMFLSVGNLLKNENVGLLFIDFETPRRLRVQGIAKIDEQPDLQIFPKAEFLIRINPTEIWVNCPRYIHRYKKVSQSPYTPNTNKTSRLAQWKRLDSVYESLLPDDKVAVEESGQITQDQYNLMISNNEA